MPTRKIPALRHQNTEVEQVVFESGAILLYLAEWQGRFLPQDADLRWQCLQWLFWQVGGLGPMAGQAHHFLKYAPHMDPPQNIPYAKDRYRAETSRLYGVLDRQLASHEFVAGDFHSIADMSIWGRASLWEGQQQTLDDKLHLARWLDTVTARPAVERGRAVAAQMRGDYKGDKAAQDRLFKRD